MIRFSDDDFKILLSLGIAGRVYLRCCISELLEQLL